MLKPLERLFSKLFPKDRLYPDTILFAICSGFVSGALFSGISGHPTFFFSVLAAVISTVFILVRRNPARWLIFIFFISLLLGSSYFFLRIPEKKIPDDPLSGIVISSVSYSKGIASFGLKSDSGSFRVISRSPIPIDCGDKIFISGIKENETDPSTIAFPQNLKIVKKGSCPVLDRLFSLKEGMIDSFFKTMPPAEAGLAAGIIFGDRTHIPEKLTEASIDTGTVHITALSGYNISVIIALFIPLSLLFPRKIRFAVVCFGIIIFVMMVQGGSSVVRAAVMGSLIFFGKGEGKKASMRNLIVFSAFVMTLFDPSVAAFDLGFELSFLALLGIVYIAPAIKRFIFKEERGNAVSNIAIDCFAAEICVLPLLLLKFGSGTIFSILPNILIVWTIPFAMLFAFLSGIIYLICPALGEIIGFFASAILSYEINTILAFDMFL